MFREMEPSKKDLHISLVLNVNLVQRIDQYAKENAIATRLAAVRELIRMGLAAAEKRGGND